MPILTPGSHSTESTTDAQSSGDLATGIYTDRALLADCSGKRKREASPTEDTAPRKRRQPLTYFKSEKQRQFLLAYVPMRQEARAIGYDEQDEVDKMVCSEFIKVFPGAVTRAGKMSGSWGTSEATPEFCRGSLKRVRRHDIIWSLSLANSYASGSVGFT